METDDEINRRIERHRELVRDLREPLGELTIEFAQLEDSTMDAVGILMRLNPQEWWALESTMRDFNSRITLFAAVIELNAPIELKALGQRVVSLIRQANSDRNNLLHDTWPIYRPDIDALNKVRIKIENDGTVVQLPVHAITVQLVKECVEFVKRVQRVLNDWRYRYQWREHGGLSQAPLPDKFYERSPLHSHMKGQAKT